MIKKKMRQQNCLNDKTWTETAPLTGNDGHRPDSPRPAFDLRGMENQNQSIFRRFRQKGFRVVSKVSRKSYLNVACYH